MWRNFSAQRWCWSSATQPENENAFYIRLHREISSQRRKEKNNKIEKWNKNKLISFSFETYESAVNVFKRNFNDMNTDSRHPDSQTGFNTHMQAAEESLTSANESLENF